MSDLVVILVPGCWHVPAHFDYVRQALTNAGYPCSGVDLPGNAVARKDGRLVTMGDDQEAIRTAVSEKLEGGHDVLLVTHSYSSMPGTAALLGLSKSHRQAAGRTFGVIGVVIIAGFLLPPGTTMLSAMNGKLAPQYLHEGDTTLPFNGPGATHVLYNDLDPVEAEKAVWKLRPQSFGTHISEVPNQVAALRDIPVHYLMCANDNAAPFDAVQIPTVRAFRDAVVRISAQVAPTGHSPFLKMPMETALFIRRAAGEEVQTGFEDFRPAVKNALYRVNR